MVGTASPPQDASLAAADAARIIETYYDPEFDEIVALAADICASPIAAISISGETGHFFLARHGTDTVHVATQDAICTLTMESDAEVMVLPDLEDDERTARCGLVLRAPKLRFYAGARFVAPSGEPLGTLCVMDTVTRPEGLTPVQTRTLRVLARKVAAQIAVKKHTRSLEAMVGLQRQDRLWRLSSDLMIVCSLDGLILAANPAWTRILGWSLAHLIGTSFLDLLHPDDRAPTTRVIDSLGQGGTINAFENRYRSADGTYRTISWNAVPDASGIYGIGRDLTRQRRAETALATSQEALNQAQKMEAVGQLTGGIAHDFRNLLATIVVNLDMLGDRIATSRFIGSDHFVTIAQKAATRACDLTERLMAFSHKREINPTPTAISQLVTGMEGLLLGAVSSAIRLDIEVEDEDWITVIDGGEFENVLLNLVINARDALVNKGRIVIKTENRTLDVAQAQAVNLKPGRYVCVAVTDDGPGMKPEVIAHAFEPFFTTKPVGSGTGLGLFMVNSFARKWGGTAFIDSALGVGTTITIMLPEMQTVSDPR